MLGDLGHARAPPHARARAGPDAATISGMTDLRGRSIRTLAWLGDAEFEREVRLRLARRGDYPTDRLHALKARVVCAEAQAELLAAIEPELDEHEAGVVRRGRNVNWTTSDALADLAGQSTFHSNLVEVRPSATEA